MKLSLSPGRSLAVLCFLFPALSGAAPGDLDTTFGGFGWVASAMGDNAVGRAVTVQSDGKIVLAGDAHLASEDIAVCRYLSDGTLDTTFNGSGKVTTDINGNYDVGQCVAVQSDGRIVVAGTSNRTGSGDFAVVRYLPNGTLDTTLGGGTGFVTIGMPGNYGRGNAMAVQSDGKIVVAGFPGFTTVRFNEDGTLDQGFGTGGRVTGSPGLEAYAIALQSDGKILVGGEGTAFILVRYNADGTPDLTFNGTGSVSTAFRDGGGATVNSIRVQGDGKIVAAGNYSYGNEVNFGIARYNPDGTPDTGFNATGKTICDFGALNLDQCQSVLLQSNGKIIVAGGTYINGASTFDIVFARFNANGTPDTGFGTGGKVLSDFGGSSEYAYGAALQPNGKLIVGGYFNSTGGGTNKFMVARYQTSLTPDISVELPEGNPLANASAAPVDFGLVASGSSGTREVTIRNAGVANLTGLAVSLTADGNPADFTAGPPAATTLVPEAETTFTVSFAPTAAGARTATLQIASNDPEKNPFIIHLAGTQATASQAWRMIHFNSTDNSGPGADLSDPDGDGIVNLMEFATGGNPKSATPAAGQAMISGTKFEYAYTRPKAALTELSYGLEWSDSLTGAWSPIGGTTVTVLSDDGVMQTVKHSISAGNSGKRFVRLRVTRL